MSEIKITSKEHIEIPAAIEEKKSKKTEKQEKVEELSKGILTESEKKESSKRTRGLDLATVTPQQASNPESEKVHTVKKRYHSVLVPTDKTQEEEKLQRTDLLTSPTIKSMNHCSKVGDCLLQTMSRTNAAEKSKMDQITTGKEPTALKAEQRFTAIVSSLKGVAARFNQPDSPIPNADDLKLLEEIVNQINKGFSSGNGGVGSFNTDKDWNGKEWEKIKFTKENYKESLGKLDKMLDFYAKKTDANFNPDQNLMGKIELSTLSLEATIGQFVNDFLLDKNMKSSSILKDEFIKHGVINQKFDQEITDFQAKLRKNPLLAEAKTADIFKQMNEGVGLEKFIKEKLLSLNETAKPKLGEAQIETMMGKIMEELKKTTDVKTSVRGRTQGIGGGASDAVAKELRGPQKNLEHFYDMPDNKDNDFALKQGLNKIKGDEVNDFIDNLNDITKHSFQPTTILRLGVSLEGNLLKMTKDTEKGIQNVLRKVIEKEEDSSIKHLLHQFDNEIKNNDSLKKEIQGLQSKIQNQEVQYNDNDKSKKMKLIDLANRNSIANIMYQNNLRTLCSISGTTTDIVLSLATHNGIDNVSELLHPLLEHAKVLVTNKDQKHRGKIVDKQFEGAQNFKEFFSTATFFMQTGKYHTSAEVLGGLLIGALASSKADNFSDEEVFHMFEVLMEDFSKHPENYFSLTNEEKKNLFAHGAHQDTENAIIASAQERARQNIAVGSKQSFIG